MQPYFLPFLGYFQLIQGADIFVIHDDVQYIKGGWINRNRILVNGAPSWITIPVLKASHRLCINQREYHLDQRIIERILRRIEGAYRHAPLFKEGFSLVQKIMLYQDRN